MEITQLTLDNCGAARGTVVVIDVLRAFTTAALAFSAGAREIMLVDTVAGALALKKKLPGALIMGEAGGFQVQAFDLGNSPAALEGKDLDGQQLIQRTSNGTQGVVCSSASAEILLAGSFVCASATVDYIRCQRAEQVTFILTDSTSDHGSGEDGACADYLVALLRGESPEVEPYLERVRCSPAGLGLARSTHPDRPPDDLTLALQVDRFDFAMRVRRCDGLLVMQPVRRGEP